MTQRGGKGGLLVKGVFYVHISWSLTLLKIFYFKKLKKKKKEEGEGNNAGALNRPAGSGRHMMVAASRVSAPGLISREGTVRVLITPIRHHTIKC